MFHPMISGASAQTKPSSVIDPAQLRHLKVLEDKILWLAVWMIHNANHLRPKRDGLKVGGHQASCASVATLMTALYFDVLRPNDRVAVKPHASPIFHAIQYLFGHQTREKLERFRAFGGAQSYPSRTKDTDDVDFSTGSVGLGVAITSFSAPVQDYLRLRGLVDTKTPPGRMIALVGDAEFDEGNVFEAAGGLEAQYPQCVVNCRLQPAKSGCRHTRSVLQQNGSGFRRDRMARRHAQVWQTPGTSFRAARWRCIATMD